MSIYHDAIEHYGAAHQILQAAQEHSEYAAELVKFAQAMLRDEKPSNGFEVASERADCEIMERQMDIIFRHLNGAKAQQKQFKLRRLSSRITPKPDIIFEDENQCDGCGITEQECDG